MTSAAAFTADEIADLWETHAMDNPDCETCRWLATITDLGAPGGAPAPVQQTEDRDPHRPQWEDCKVCGGDHWTKDHPMHHEPADSPARQPAERPPVAFSDPNADNPDGWNVMGFEPRTPTV